jgi:hypothetical protein
MPSLATALLVAAGLTGVALAADEDSRTSRTSQGSAAERRVVAPPADRQATPPRPFGRLVER